MRTFLLLLTCLISFAFLPAKNAAQRYFYFYISKSAANPADASIRQTILYSGVHQVTAEEADVKAKAKTWQNWVNTRCASRTGCTGDINYYTTREDAKAAHTKTLAAYSDTTRFILQKVKFQ